MAETCVFTSKVQQLLAVVEASGFELQKDGKPVGGLAVARPYLECALLAEGRRLDRASARAAAGADLLFCSGGAAASSSPSSSSCRAPLTVAGCTNNPCPLVPIEDDDDEDSTNTTSTNTSLPADLGPALRKALGPQAVSELHWGRVPSVALLARGALPEAALAAAALAGVPVSPSLAGPHQEEVPTIVEVFLKAPPAAQGAAGNSSSSSSSSSKARYPETRLLLLRDGGFLALGADIDEAAAAFARAARARLLGESAYAAVSEACGLPATAAATTTTTPAPPAAIATPATTSAAGRSPTLAAFDGLGSGALVGSHPLLLPANAASSGGAGQPQQPQQQQPGASSRRPNSDTARAVPLFSLGGAATALRRLGHSLLGGRPTLGGRASEGATDLIALGDSGGGAAAGGAGTMRAGASAALRPSLPGVRGLFQGGAGTGASPFALPTAGPLSGAGLPPAHHSGAGARSRTSQGNAPGGLLAPSGGSITALCRKNSESAANRPLPSSFTFGGLKPW